MHGLFKENNKIMWKGYGEIVWIEPYGENCLRFRSTKRNKIEDINWTLLPAKPSNVTINMSEQRAEIINGNIKAEILIDGTVNYYKADGTVLLKESWIDEREHTVPLRPARDYNALSTDSFEISLYFKPNADEKLYGMGQHANNCFDLKGCTIELQHKNTQCSIPFVVSSIGYGFMWNNPAVGQADLVNNHTKWNARASKQLDYIVIAEDSTKEIVRKYTDLVGKSPMLPEWAAGFWQCKLRYETQEELLTVAREYKKRNLPISVIVIDFFHWTQQGDWKFDPQYWPDPKAMVDELKAMDIVLMVSVWPTVDPESENYEYMVKNDMLIKPERGVNVFFMFKGPETYIDVTNPESREFLWDTCKKNYYDYGIDMFWLDEAEPEIRPYQFENVRYYEGNGLEVSGIYPYRYAQAYYEGLKKEGKKDIVNLLRCCWHGSQRFGTVAWSGDIASTFESLEKQVKVGLHMALCGVPWWTTDIGGFFNGDPQDEMFRELMIRWFEYGCFCPIFRLHGFRLPEPAPGSWRSGGPNEVWSFGEKAYEILSNYLFVRENIKEYIMEQMANAAKTGDPVMRPLFYDFDDKQCFDIGDEFMFGSDMLVAPVLKYKARSRRVYLPKGATWVDAFDGKEYAGGATYEIDAPLEKIPVFYKNDARYNISEK